MGFKSFSPDVPPRFRNRKTGKQTRSHTDKQCTGISLCPDTSEVKKGRGREREKKKKIDHSVTGSVFSISSQFINNSFFATYHSALSGVPRHVPRGFENLAAFSLPYTDVWSTSLLVPLRFAIILYRLK